MTKSNWRKSILVLAYRSRGRIRDGGDHSFNSMQRAKRTGSGVFKSQSPASDILPPSKFHLLKIPKQGCPLGTKGSNAWGYWLSGAFLIHHVTKGLLVLTMPIISWGQKTQMSKVLSPFWELQCHNWQYNERPTYDGAFIIIHSVEGHTKKPWRVLEVIFE